MFQLALVFDQFLVLIFIYLPGKNSDAIHWLFENHLVAPMIRGKGRASRYDYPHVDVDCIMRFVEKNSSLNILKLKFL